MTTDRAAAGPRPAHHDPALLALVFLGGAAGTALRALISLVPTVDAVSFATIGINVLGAFALGALLTALAGRGLDTGARRRLRLGAGTGVLGGFTTYSALAVDAASLAAAGRIPELLLSAAGTVLAGLAAAWAGSALVRRASR